MNIDRLKEEHVVVLTAVTELKNLVKRGIAENADAIATAIVSMSSRIKLHLAAEDRFLYPSLANSTNPAVARLGKTFQQEMGHIAAVYAQFAGKWNSAMEVTADPEGFRADANNVFKALHQRIQRENQELYPLVERDERAFRAH